jgi:hypothetical protein
MLSAITVRGHHRERPDGADAKQQVRQFGAEQVRACGLIEQGAARAAVTSARSLGSCVHGRGTGSGLRRLNLGGCPSVADAHEHAPAALEAWHGGIDVAGGGEQKAAHPIALRHELQRRVSMFERRLL